MMGSEPEQDIPLVNSLASELEPSPLGEYLADTERTFEGSTSSIPMEDDATIRRARRRRARGSTRIRGSSCSTSPSRVSSPTRPSMSSKASSEDLELRPGSSQLQRPTPQRTATTSDNPFAERFRYLIASSGLLEKTQVGGLSAPSISQEEDARSEVSREDGSGADWGELRRWDIMTSFAVVVLSLAYLLGPKTAMVPTVVLATGIALHVFHKQNSDSPTASEEPKDATGEETTGQGRVVRGLETLLDESKNLDQSISAALRVLVPRPDDTELAHELRIALHRLYDDMTDSLAAATSSLTPLADKAELAVLGEMYDVQVTGIRRRLSWKGQEEGSPTPDQSTGRPRSSSAAATTPESLKAALLSPREHLQATTPIRGLAAPFDPNDRFTKMPDRSSRQARHKRASWSTDWSSRSPLFNSGHEGRFENDETSESMASMSSTEDSSVPASIPDSNIVISPPSASKPPYTPKRASPLTQALARLEAATDYPSPPFPVLKARPTHSPYRRSLQDIPYLPATPESSRAQAVTLAIARATTSMSSDKRRSLQSPGSAGPAAEFAREQILTGANLQRARSFPHSKRNGLRTMVTPGRKSLSPSHAHDGESTQASSPALRRLSLLSGQRSNTTTPQSKRSSLVFNDAPRSSDAYALGLGMPQGGLALPRPSRIASVSPLTLGGLRASCLGVHLRRRRVACCLLGLRFLEPADSSYWDDVCAVLATLSSAMAAARTKLDVLRADAERETEAVSAIAAMAKSPMTPSRNFASSLPQSQHDFAPRESADQVLSSSLDELQRTLAHVWALCEDIRAGSDEGIDVAPLWTDVRADIGTMLRHVERGRDVTRMEREEAPFDEPEPETHTMPSFVRAWADASPGPQEIERLLDTPVDEVEEKELLPPPGADEVFEGVAAPAVTRARSALSRDDRIALAREARARGVTLAQLTAASDPERQAEVEREAEATKLRSVSGEMVAELEGMFGAIRKRKGMA